MERAIDYIGYRVLLFIFGFFNIQRERAALRQKTRTTLNVQPNIIISNHCSYIDILYMKCIYSPVFCALSSDGYVRPLTVLEALLYAGSYPRKFRNDEQLTLVDLLKMNDKLKPICIFIEGTTTNGRGFLEFIDVFKRVDVTYINVCMECLKFLHHMIFDKKIRLLQFFTLFYYWKSPGSYVFSMQSGK